MNFRAINNWLHLWLGLISGVVVFIVCVMACIWVFQEEITDIFHPPIHVETRDKPVLLPSQVMALMDSLHPHDHLHAFNYRVEEPIYIFVEDSTDRHFDYLMDPYTGRIYGKSTDIDKSGIQRFFGWVLDGHRFLWLPYEIGRPIVNYSCVIFLVLLITGLVWWYPKKWTKSTREKSFKIKWTAGWKRINLDLHNVLGFYAMLILFALACTGIVYGLEWFSRGLYWATTGGDSLPGNTTLYSDSTQSEQPRAVSQILDNAFLDVTSRHPHAYGYHLDYPDHENEHSPIRVNAYPYRGQSFRNSYYLYDRYTGVEIANNESFYVRPLKDNNFGENLRKMNYDIHVGVVLGFPGKVLAFFCSLIGASLPVTGFIIWYNRKWGKKAAKKSRRIKPISELPDTKSHRPVQRFNPTVSRKVK